MSRYIRDADKIYSEYLELIDEKVIVKKPVKVHVPARFVQQGLAYFENESATMGIFCVIGDDTHYAVSLVPSMIQMEPSRINAITVDDQQYLELSFDVGAALITNTNLVVDDANPYRISDELISKGRIPWYVNPNDALRLFSETRYYCKFTTGKTRALAELVVANVYRSENDPKVFLREVVTSQEDIEVMKPTIIPLRAVAFGASNTIAKLLGNFFSENLTSAMISDPGRVERVEALLRV